MNIRFISSLAPEDERRLVKGLLAAFATLLDQLPIAYTLKIDADNAGGYDHKQPLAERLTPPSRDNVSR
jgi:hypothetical protein